MKSLQERTSLSLSDWIGNPTVEVHGLSDDGQFPNNARLPALVYRTAFHLPPHDPAAIIEEILCSNDWHKQWRNGIYGYHHYHSTAHEFLGIAAGHAEVMLGGPRGAHLTITAGDALLIPAGVAHKNLESTASFLVVGAYPPGQEWDLCIGKPGERPKADQNIAAVNLPTADPVLGLAGPLQQFWLSSRRKN